MMAFRAAAYVAALVTVTLNASYGFKTSTALEYAVLFAALNAALDIAKCSCLAGAAGAWHAGHRIAGIVLFLLFWPLLANSLWCGLSEVTFNRAAETSRHETDTQARSIAAADHARASAELADLEASPLYKTSTACALPKTNRERTLCAKRAEASTKLRQAADALARQSADDPTPQLTLLSSITGVNLPALMLAAAFWPIALAELCGGVGFYLTCQSDRAKPRWNVFRRKSAATASPAVQTAPKPVPRTPAQTTVQWPTITS